MIKILLAIVLSGAMIWFVWQMVVVNEQPIPFVGGEQTSEESSTTEAASNDTETEPAPRSSVLSEYFPVRAPMSINGVSVEASIARTKSERALGLSGTPRLPTGIVKLFVFEEDAAHSFWMKDMNYSIDIVWIDANSTIVHIEPSVSPDTYPNSFTPPVPARYVIETQAGFMAKNNIVTGDSIVLPNSLRN